MPNEVVLEETITFESPVGLLTVSASPSGLRRVRLPNAVRVHEPRGLVDDAKTVAPDAQAQILQYLDGERLVFDLPLDLAWVDDDTRRVLDELVEHAPWGTVVTYGDLASWSGHPGGARGVGQVMARNPIPLVIPCHRVLATGDLGGFGGGIELKEWLLRLEGSLRHEQPDLFEADETG